MGQTQCRHSLLMYCPDTQPYQDAWQRLFPVSSVEEGGALASASSLDTPITLVPDHSDVQSLHWIVLLNFDADLQKTFLHENYIEDLGYHYTVVDCKQ